MDDSESLSHSKWSTNTTWYSFRSAEEKRCTSSLGRILARYSGSWLGPKCKSARYFYQETACVVTSNIDALPYLCGLCSHSGLLIFMKSGKSSTLNLQRWPTLAQLMQARQTTLRTFFHVHNSTRPKLIEARLQSIKAAVALTEDPGVIVPNRFQVLGLVEISCERLCRPLIGLTARLPNWPRPCRVIPYLRPCLAPVRIWRPVCSPLSASSVNAFRKPKTCRNTRASRP